MEFRFYIYGSPEIFDLYAGNTGDITYFQTYYDGSKENTKLTIHRRVNGQVTYSYLRYNMISGSGRSGAFFGMSIVFTDIFIYDIKKIYRLFETVYNDRILKNRILLEEIQGNPEIQAKYLIRKFEEQDLEVRNIENIITKNIKNYFSIDIENKSSGDIRSLDSSFKQGKPNLIRKLNINKDNDYIINTLRDYSWISISSEYPETVDEISQEMIMNYPAASSGVS
jgi:hypothetical protein